MAFVPCLTISGGGDYSGLLSSVSHYYHNNNQVLHNQVLPVLHHKKVLSD